MLRRRQQARFMFSENSVTITRNYPVQPIPQESWQDAARTSQSPHAAERIEHVQDRIRSH